MLPVHCRWCLVSIRGGEGVKYSHVKGLLKLPPQTPLADTSNLAPSWLLAEAPLSWSGVTGCKSGSTHTSLHTSVSRESVMSWISLCLRDGKPPFAQESACSTLNLLPHSHLEGRRDGVQPYHTVRASWKADLCNVNPCSVRSRTVSQVEALFTFAKSTCLGQTWYL